MKTPVRPYFLSLFLTANLVGVGSLSAQLTWDSNGVTTPDPSDGSGSWLGAGLWWDGTSRSTWDNVANADTIAIFGVGGTSGTVTLGSGVSAGGLRFGPSGSTGYLINGGTLTLASNAVIDIRDLASSSGGTSRVRLAGAINTAAGANITISNAVAGGNFASYATLSGSNTWKGNLNLTGNTSGLFVDVTTPNALNTLSSIVIGSTATLALNNSTTTYSVPSISIGGVGLGERGSLRFDNGTVNLSSNIVLTSDGRISTNSTGIGVITGVISGGYNLAVNSSTDTINRIVLKNSTNHSFAQFTVNRGNVQIGEAGVGSSGTGVVNLAGTAANPATISGTGRALSGLYVTGGTISPGDNGGVDMGTLSIGANLNFTGLTAPQVAPAATFTVGAGGTSDRLNVTNNLLLSGNGNFSVALASGYIPAVGDSFTLVTWGGALTQNTFSIGENLRTGADGLGNEGNLNLPDLTTYGYLWDVALGGGALTARIVIPEPSHAMLGMFGLLAFLGVRRR